MQFTTVWIVTLCVYIVTVLAIPVLAKILAKPVDSYAFSFKRMFPFEVITRNEKTLVYRIFLYVFVIACFAPLFNMLTNYGQIMNIQGISIAICCVFGLASICFVFLHYFDATHTFAHLCLFVCFICLTMLGNALAAIKGITVYGTYAKHDQKMYVCLIGGIICGACALLSAIVALNPRLKNWPNLQKLDSGYARPRVFILAFSEWLSYFLLAIGELAYFLVLLIQ